jgi:hypothetical protein
VAATAAAATHDSATSAAATAVTAAEERRKLGRACAEARPKRPLADDSSGSGAVSGRVVQEEDLSDEEADSAGAAVQKTVRTFRKSMLATARASMLSLRPSTSVACCTPTARTTLT